MRAARKAKKMQVNINMTKARIGCHIGGSNASLVDMTMGEKNGINDEMTDSELLGARIAPIARYRPITINKVNGIIICCDSPWSSPTALPIAAQIAANKKYPPTKNNKNIGTINHQCT